MGYKLFLIKLPNLFMKETQKDLGEEIIEKLKELDKLLIELIEREEEDDITE